MVKNKEIILFLMKQKKLFYVETLYKFPLFNQY